MAHKEMPKMVGELIKIAIFVFVIAVIFGLTISSATKSIPVKEANVIKSVYMGKGVAIVENYSVITDKKYYIAPVYQGNTFMLSLLHCDIYLYKLKNDMGEWWYCKVSGWYHPVMVYINNGNHLHELLQL